ncbi:unnamed protein product [Sphenostylis stenocarpa]|uniref:C-JID domain-containing protein n=1 Tax=Sphenostylis stenocarpa TaxID=92480 RepID=A0AA86W4Z9_9FABA|nr:unnamed protein product [Sphenostylis stenocarpa]
MRADPISKIKHLKLLNVEDMNSLGSLSYLSNELGYLIWNKYAFDCLPPSFQPGKLVELNLRGSNIDRLWHGTKPLHNLKRLDLSFSKNLVEMPDLRDALNLERLALEGCIKLRKINPSLGLLRKLAVLNLTNCINLVSLPKSIFGLTSLQYLSVSGCSKLYNNELIDEPRNEENLKKLCLVEAPIHSQSTSSLIKKWLVRWPLDLLYSRAQRDSISYLIPSSATLPYLRELDLSFCNLVQIPDAIEKLHCLEKLNLKGNNFVTLPSLKDLFRLYNLNIQHCKRLKYFPNLPSRTQLPSDVYSVDLSYSPSVATRFIPDDEVSAGLIVFNCPELVDRERFTSMSVSWMIQIFQANHQYGCLGPDVESIIPGSEIPRWFNYQHVSMDNSIVIDASPVMHDNNWIVVVCCAIFQVREMHSPRKTSDFRVTIPVDVRRDLLMDDSDHMWIFYLTHEEFIDQCNSTEAPNIGCLKMKMKIQDMEDFREYTMKHGQMDETVFLTKKHGQMEAKIFPVEVKKYGYRWVSEQDLKLSNSTMMHDANLITGRHKFLAMEKNR